MPIKKASLKACLISHTFTAGCRTIRQLAIKALAIIVNRAGRSVTGRVQNGFQIVAADLIADCEFRFKMHSHTPSFVFKLYHIPLSKGQLWCAKGYNGVNERNVWGNPDTFYFFKGWQSDDVFYKT